MTVHLQTFRVRERDYRGSRNPPILHRKETFLAPDHQLHAKFSRLTRQEESKGLYEDTVHIGTRRGWEQVLADKGFTLRGPPAGTRQNKCPHRKVTYCGLRTPTRLDHRNDTYSGGK